MDKASLQHLILFNSYSCSFLLFFHYNLRWLSSVLTANVGCRRFSHAAGLQGTSRRTEKHFWSLSALWFNMSSPGSFAGFWVSDSSNRCCLITGWEPRCTTGSVRVDRADKQTAVQDVELCQRLSLSAAGLWAGSQRRNGRIQFSLFFSFLSLSITALSLRISEQPAGENA